MSEEDEKEMTEAEIQEKEDQHIEKLAAEHNYKIREILKDSGEYPVMSYEKLRDIKDEVSEIKYSLFFVMTFLIIIGLVLIYIAFNI